MGKSQGKVENTKKAAGNAKKAEAAAKKTEAENAKVAAAETAQWKQGAKSSAKKEEAEAKKQEAARKKAERDAQLAEEEKNARATPKGANQKTAQKKSKGLDLAMLDDAPASSSALPSLNATGIENAIDALEITAGAASDKVDRYPERRFKAAYAVFEARRLPELEVEHKGLRRNQRVALCMKEFEKSEENPFNKLSIRYDASKDEIREAQAMERARKEGLLTEGSK